MQFCIERVMEIQGNINEMGNWVGWQQFFLINFVANILLSYLNLSAKTRNWVNSFFAVHIKHPF